MSAPRRTWAPVVVLVVALVMVTFAHCRRGRPALSMDALMASVDAPGELDDVDRQVGAVDGTEWVELYCPDEAWNGYTLVLYRRRMPMIIDMNGRIVHWWPRVRATGRVRLDRAGRLAVIGTDDVVKEYDWDGRIRFAYRLPREDQLPHHDFIQLANGNYLILGRKMGSRHDFLHEVDREGRLVWRWQAIDFLRDRFPAEDLEVEDPTHLNSIQELPDNAWFDGGDERFRPGNILVSARNLNAVFIIDRRSGELVWQYSNGLDFQHEALMIPNGQPHAGRLIVFDNGYRNRLRYRQSRVVIIDPVNEREVWSYQSPDFYSSVAGSAQALPNGNVLVSSSQGGRVFEITPGGSLVWQWIPPFEPMRELRLPYDHCPQLAALPRPELTSVRREDRPRWLDVELHQFTIPEEHVVRELHGKRRQLVPFQSGCRTLVLPAGPVLRIGYGLDPERIGEGAVRARFTLTLARDGDVQAGPLHSGEVGSGDAELWRNLSIPLTGMDFQRVNLCLETDVDADHGSDDTARVAFWENPTVFSSARAELRRRWLADHEDRAEDELQRRQLEAIGYVQ